MGLGARMNMGPCACLEVGNVSIVVGCGRFQTMDDGPFYVAGVDWRSKHILAIKSAQHFKAWWADRVKHIVACNSPGIHSSDLSTIPFENADTSFFPLQEDAVWEG
jgi:microcystin degradation protein MlrC